MATSQMATMIGTRYRPTQQTPQQQAPQQPQASAPQPQSATQSAQQPKAPAPVTPSNVAPPPGTNPSSPIGSPAQSPAPQNSINFSNKNDSSVHSTFYDAANQWAQQGNEIAGEAAANQQYYGNAAAASRAQGSDYASPIGAAPGYTPTEASNIAQNYSQYITPQSQINATFLNPNEQQEIAGNPYAPVSVASQGVQNAGQELNAYQANLGSQAAQGQSWLSANLPQYSQQLQNSLAGERQSLSTATEGQRGSVLSPQDVEALSTQAGATVGNLYQSQMDQVRRQAAASGNTSPLALAAAENRLVNEQGGAVGNAMANARLAAQEAEFGQQTQLAGENIGMAQNLAGQEQQAASAYQNAQANAAQNSATLGFNAAQAAGTAGLAEQENATNTMYGASSNAEQQAANRAAALASNRQQAQENANSTQFGQGLTAGQATAQGYEATGNARMNQQQQYLNYLQGEEQLATQAQLNSVGQQIQNLGTTGGLVNQDVAGRAGYQVQNNNVAMNAATGLIGAIAGAGNAGANGYRAYNGAAKGGSFSEPQPVLVGEKGPEMILHQPELSGEKGFTAPAVPHESNMPRLQHSRPPKIHLNRYQPHNYSSRQEAAIHASAR